MIIPVKLKPFAEWPCQREGFAICCEQEAKLAGLEIELDGERYFEDPWRKGWSCGITDESIQRMYAVGALGRHAIIPRSEALELRVCEHMIEPRSLWSGLLRAEIRKRMPRLCRSRARLSPAYLAWRCGKFFNVTWNENWDSVWMGKVVARIGERGAPLYRVELFPESAEFPGGSSTEYLVTHHEITLPRWKFYDSFADMMDTCLEHRQS